MRWTIFRSARENKDRYYKQWQNAVGRGVPGVYALFGHNEETYGEDLAELYIARADQSGGKALTARTVLEAIRDADCQQVRRNEAVIAGFCRRGEKGGMTVELGENAHRTTGKCAFVGRDGG